MGDRHPIEVRATEQIDQLLGDVRRLAENVRKLEAQRAELFRRAAELCTEASRVEDELDDWNSSSAEVAEASILLDAALTWNDMVHEVMGEESETDG